MSSPKLSNSISVILVVLCILIFLFAFFYTIIQMPIYQLDDNLNNTSASAEHLIQLIGTIHDSMFKIFLGVVVFSIICLVIVFGSSFRLLFNKEQLQVDVGVSENEITLGMGGIKQVVDDTGNIQLHNTEVYRQLTEDYIISDVDPDGKPLGYVTMESYLRGFKSYCEKLECEQDLFTLQEVKKDQVYAPDEYVHLGENIHTVANKMLNQRLTALPVLDSKGRMIGSINYLQVIRLLNQNKH
ncbi:CBS domain-containing protein [Desulforamulus ferrireducens]|uniref:CBS domain-containing protein n=1 Tax=Desulforamulus ferrireducens TaxID=1833852 RepID=A0A1S6ISN7_9FIRM|nr:CBS domain-containing protein [Desulforamulus ferrireducens]AQS57774.1 hypothetical protein B0537_00765 [Desulforamulus ferrireducens]